MLLDHGSGGVGEAVVAVAASPTTMNDNKELMVGSETEYMPEGTVFDLGIS